MWRLIAVVVLAIGVVQAQNTSSSTAECPNVPGFFYQDSCKLLCRETKWTDVVVFYLGNYIAHAATITTRPGQSTLITVVTMIGAVLLPGTGIWNGMKAILSLARFAPTDLQTAARAGALYAVVKDDSHHPSQASVSDGAEGIQMVAMPATVATRSTQQEQNIEKQLLEDSSVHEDSNESNGMTGLLSSNIHGLCELPEGYHLMQVPRKATFAGEDDLPVDHRPWYHYRRLANTIFPWTQPQPTRSTVALSCSYNLVRVLASIIQLIFAISTLYRTRGDQIERYGYAAFGLTVIPYAWMSLINLVGNAICPQYDKIYVVSSRALRDLQLARKEGSQDSQTQDQTQWRVDGTVGRLEDHWDEQLCKAFEYCREHEGAEQTGRTRPLLYTVFATWNRKSPSRMILGPFIDLLNPFRHWKDWVEDTRRARRWWKDEVVRVAREIRQDPKSGMFSFYHRWKEQLLAPLIVFVVPLAIVGGLSGFQPGQSEPFQRVWVMMWLILGLGVGFVLGQALRWFGNQSPNVYQQPTADCGGPNGFVSLWETIMGAVAYGPIAIGGHIHRGNIAAISAPIYMQAENHGAANRHRVYGVKMALAARKAASLKPEIRLAQAVSEFEAGLDSEHKASFRNMRFATTAAPPTLSDVMKLTAEVDSRVRKDHGPSRCFGPRLTNILQAVQQFAALGDTVVGGSQNLVACGIWSAVRMMLQIAIGYVSYLEKLSLLFMAAGRSAPRYQALAIIYPQSKALQTYLSEYFIVVVRICQTIQQYAKRSTFSQFRSSLNDADLKQYQEDLEIWGGSIKDEASLLLHQVVQNENRNARALMNSWSTFARQPALELKMRWLNACSTYDYQTTWKQIRRRGWTSLLETWGDYTRWKERVEIPSAILFSGKVGAGKSVLLANIVDDLNLIGDTIVVYFFCRHDVPESLKARTILGSLTRQYLFYISHNHEIFREDVAVLDLDDLVAMIRSEHDDRQRYLLIDGLDECNSEEQHHVLSQISRLQGQSNWRLGFSARFSAKSFVEQHIILKWRVSLPTSNPDIGRFIDSELEARLTAGQLTLGDPRLLLEIRTALLAGANGMFLWVALQLDQICLEVSDHSIRLAIESLPRDLSEMYARILRKSAARDTGRYHVRLFKFLAAAYVPLTIDEIKEMASVTIGDTTWDSSKCINDILKVLGFCGSLVMIEEEEQTVRFVHHSAKSFCQGVLVGLNHWQNCFSDDEAHREIGETAVTYLSYGIFDTRLSTQVIPKIDVSGATERIIQQTLGTSNRLTRLALGFVRPKKDSTRDIGQFVAHTRRGTTAGAPETTDHPFLSYAKNFWLLHTRSIENLAVIELWEQLFNEVNIHKLQLTPHVPGPLDNLEVPCQHPLASAFVWAINYSHIAIFDRLMAQKADYTFSTKLPWARFRLFRSLLQHLHPQGSFAQGPSLEPRMMQRLLPLAIVLRVYRAVESMLPCLDHTEIPQAFEIAVSCGNYKSAAFISNSRAFRHPKKVVLHTKLLTIASAFSNSQMISLLVKMGAGRLADVNATALSSVLQSDMHQAPLLRTIFILANAGIRPDASNQQVVRAALHLLALSPELNIEMGSRAIMSMLTAGSNFPGLHQHILHHACLVGSFELANAAWLSYFNLDREVHKVGVGKVRGFPFEGDELSLVLQTISRSRVKLADWLVKNGCRDKMWKSLRRAIVLRHWQIADALLDEVDLKSDAFRFCKEHELLHVCVVEGDLIGIDFLLKIGMNFNDYSTGQMFKYETSVQALTSQSSDCFIHITIADLCTRGVFATTRISPGFTLMKDSIDSLMLPDNSTTWNSDIRKIAREQLERGTFSDNYCWFICAFAACVRKVVRAYFLPLDGDTTTGLDHLENWLEFLKEMLHSDLASPVCNKHEGILILREVFSIASALDKAITAVATTYGSSPRNRLEAQMRLWEFVDLFVDRRSRGPIEELSRDGALQELSCLICQRPIDGVIQGIPYERLTKCKRESVQSAMPGRYKSESAMDSPVSFYTQPRCFYPRLLSSRAGLGTYGSWY